MKKIGILFGKENTFPKAFVDRINEDKKPPGIVAEFAKIDKVVQAAPCGYAVVLDRISQDVPFYRAYLKNAAASGTIVINNPFWWSADEKFFNNSLAESIGVAVPKTVLLPSQERPPDTSEMSFRNLAFPLDWEGMFDYIGFPAYFKPFAGGGWKHVYKIEDRDHFFEVYKKTGTLVMMLQEEIRFTSYYRCYCVGRHHVRIMEYDPRRPFNEQYSREPREIPADLHGQMEKVVLELNRALGYDLNTVELAIRDGVPYAIDFCNPAPDADVHSVGEANFEWIVEHMANLAIERAQQHRDGHVNIEWGEFVNGSVQAGREVGS